MDNDDVIKVLIHTIDDECYTGYMYISKENRIQDILNDDRKFLPLQIISNTSLSSDNSILKYKTVLINKSVIARLEHAE